MAKLTKRQKKYRQEVKRQMQEQGLLPPDKPRLNRKKFAQEVDEAFKKEIDLSDYVFFLHLFYSALAFMHNDGKIAPITDQQLGVIKLEKIMIELNRKQPKTIGEAYEVAQEIIKM